MADDLLDCLLSAAIEIIPETQSSPKASFCDTLGMLDKAAATIPKKQKSLLQLSPSEATPRLSTIHHGDTDSSDDEDNRDFENRQYNESGRNIKHLLQTSVSAVNPYSTSSKTTWKAKPEAKKPVESSSPLFGMRIINPLISSKSLEDRLNGREVITLARMKMFVRNVSSDKDWVVAGVIVHKSTTKTSQKGKNYCILTLSDLKSDLKTVVVFLFGSAYKEFWKIATGTVIGILNPSVMELREGSKDEACLSVDHHQRVMIIGQSKDLGTCKSTRKNGERCTAFVNTHMCEFCIYHVKQEYQRASKRSDIQSGFAGRGLTALRNKVLGKNQVFYAGKLYSAIPAAKNRKQIAKDDGRLRALAGFAAEPRGGPVKSLKQKQAARLEIAADQRRKDLERLRQLGINTEPKLNNQVETFNGTLSRDVTVEDSKLLALDVIGKLKKNQGGGENKQGNAKKVSREEKQTTKQLVEKLKKKNDDLGMDFKNFEEPEIAARWNGNKPDQTRKAKKKLKEKFQEENVALSVDFKSLKGSELAVKCNEGKPEETPKLNIILRNKFEEDDIDLNVDFKNFQKKFLNPQIVNQEQEIFKPLSKDNKIQNRPELDQDLNNSHEDLNKRKNSLKPQATTYTREIFKPLPEGNKTQNHPELDQKSNKYLNNTASLIVSHDSGKSPNLPATKTGSLTNIPFLSNKGKAQIDLSVPVRRKQAVRAKQNALSWVQNHGPIEKKDPNNTRGSEKGKKRALESLSENENPKKSKIEENGFFSQRFKKMMAATSNHLDLLEDRDNEEQEKYFHKLEMKERMEEKMLTTYKVACKAVRCLKCKYTSFSASDMCKAEKHPLRVFDAMKRFFKCGNCGNRTVCLELVPTISCKNCGRSKWEKTSMMKERKVEIAAPKLSIRGGEQKFTNSIISDANLDLMVPDEQ